MTPVKTKEQPFNNLESHDKKAKKMGAMGYSYFKFRSFSYIIPKNIFYFSKQLLILL